MVYVSLGSNIGHRIDYLQRAIVLIKENCLRNVRCSIVLETDAILPHDAPASWNSPFLNMVVAGETDLSPEHLLQELKKIESQLKRPEEHKKWAPRTIDLDILLWENLKVDTPQLKIPHPELHNRPFLMHLLALMGVTSYKKEALCKCFSKSFVVYPRFVGIVNITNDSFSDGGHCNTPDKALAHASKLVADGASIIEIGAQSTRPSAIIQPPHEEYAKLKPVLDGLVPLMQEERIKVSVDTFQPLVIRSVLERYPISWINDVKGELDEPTLQLIHEHGCKLCLMHSLGIPPEKNVTLPFDTPPIKNIITWAQKNTACLLRLGFKNEDIIIDPGIGFGKSAYQTIEILQHLEELKNLGTQILVGHSRKSYLEAFTVESAPHRDIETLAISACIQQSTDFLRVHNVADHMRFFAAYKSLHKSFNGFL